MVMFIAPVLGKFDIEFCWEIEKRKSWKSSTCITATPLYLVMYKLRNAACSSVLCFKCEYHNYRGKSQKYKTKQLHVGWSPLIIQWL